jgi:toxin ParE1/3/4
MPELKWSRASLDDLRSIDRYLAEVADGATAVRALMAIRERADALRDFPRIGPIVSDRGFHSLVVRNTPYVILYRFHDGVIEIVRIHHQQQNWRSDLL